MTLDGYSILVIDDDEAVGEVIALQLEQFGAQTRLCLNLSDATVLLGSEKYDAVITDYRIPPDSALDVLKIPAVKKLKIPVIILTGLSDFDLAEIMNLGASWVLDKPVAPKFLCEKLLECINHTR